jgi:hypothetical protein
MAALKSRQQQQPQQCNVSASRRLAAQRLVSLQQQMLSVSSQMRELESMVAGYDAVAADAASIGPMQMMLMQQQQQQYNAALLP